MCGGGYLRLRIDETNNAKHLYVIKSFRDSSGKSTSKIVEKLGTLEALSLVHADPIAWANEYIDELNRQEKEAQRKVIVQYNPSRIIEMGKATLFEGGYLFLQKIYYELRLDYICKKISQRYNYEYDLNAILSSYTYGRILMPKSKLGTYDYVKRFLEPPTYQLQDVYRALEVIAKENDYIQAALYKFTAKRFKRNDRVLYYDCTNYYFEIEEESGIRKYGVSKENRPNPIVQMGLFMDGDGIPLAFCINAGNTNEQTTLKPLEKKIIDDFQHGKFVVCTDAGLSSIGNRKFNSNANRAFITAQSIKVMKDFQKEWALSLKGWRVSGDNQTYDLEKILANDALVKAHQDFIFYKERWFNENGLEQRYIVTFSIKYMLYMREVRSGQIERAGAAIASSKLERTRQTDYKRFITKTSVTEHGEAADTTIYSLNEDKIKEEERYDGFYAVATCLQDPADVILRVNRGRWEIEECFRIMKSEFNARPVYLSRDDRIKAHFTICFLALIIFRYMEKRLGGKYTCRQIIDGLRSMVFQHVPGEGYIPAYTRTEFTDALHNAFGFRTDYQIIPVAELKKILRTTRDK